jgi:calmodulin
MSEKLLEQGQFNNLQDSSDEQVEIYREAFYMYDKNGDNKISLEEFGEVIKSLGLSPSKEELVSLMNEIDLDGNGLVEFNEFAIWMSIKMSDHSNLDKGVDLANTFKIFDQDGDNFITSDELKSVMLRLGQRMTDEEINLMITEADTDHDHRVSFKEFAQLMKKFEL